MKPLDRKISYSILGMLFVICAYYFVHEQVFMKTMFVTDDTLFSVHHTQVQNNPPQNNISTSSADRRVPPTEPSVPTVQGKVVTFAGILEKVDTGCFADGECFVEVGGKHVTALMGWTQAVVGTVQGVDGFGDLTNHIGEKVEVRAQEKTDGTYTLYGSEGFYIKLISTTTVPVTTKPVAGCIVGGCSAQLCTDASNGPVASTCEYRAEYACYKTAKCERQGSGQCGWTETSELNQCLVSTKSNAPILEVQ